MNSVTMKRKRLQYAVLTLAAMMAASSANAVGTLSGTPVNNTASVDYEVNGINQEDIESSPTGNSTAGAGAGTPTSFVVDNIVDLVVAEIGGAVTTGTPGETLLVTTFRVTNEGNTPQDYALSVVNLDSSDPDVHGNPDTDVDMTAFAIFVDTNDDNAYTAVDDVDTFIDGLAPDDDIEVFVVATAPLGAGSSDFANIRLTATTYDDGSGATGSPTAETAGADTTSVDVVFGDGAGLPADVPDGLEWADDGYAFITADLEIQKISRVDEDPFNGTTDPKAIPGAYVEYEITLTNNGSVDADSIVVSDTLAAEVTPVTGRYDVGVSDADIEIQPEGAASIFCTYDNTDADGCALTGSVLTISLADPVGSTPADDEVTILFQVEIL